MENQSTFEIIFKIATIIIAILTVLIAWKVFIAGNKQFEKNLEISASQLKLAKTVRDETISSERPILAIATSGFTPILEDNYFEYLLKLQNYGGRPAFDININLFTLGYNKNQDLEIIDKLFETSSNPLTKNMQWDLGRTFKTLYDSKIYIYLKIEYRDLLADKILKEDFLYFIPERKYLNNRQERGIINASKKELDIISNFVNEAN
ncbi:MAG: hypothetical protein DRI87_02350 [Bacteroidetes bacterium]|nr:MAG: hypothetical protein DRI87_02350 [Bacteroidota bacterium]